MQVHIIHIFFDLIEPYWNVKLIEATRTKALGLDLIEPYWNVKMIVVCMEIDKFADLIEPYWNVKAEHLILENHI